MTAHAQSTAQTDAAAAEARRQLVLATAAFEAKRYAEAATGFDAAVSVHPNAVTLFIAAVSWDEAKRPDRAADDYARAIALAGLDANRARTARMRLAELEQTLATLRVSAPMGWRVRLDAVPFAPAPARLHAMPGRHTLESMSVDGSHDAEQTHDVVLVMGQVRAMTLRDSDADEPPPVETIAEPQTSGQRQTEPRAEELPAERSGWPASRVIGVTSMAAGAATMGAAVFLGLRVLDARDAYNAAPTRDALDHARAMQTLTNVCWIAGGGLVALGAGLTFLPGLLKPTPATGVAFNVTATATAAGPGIDLRGAF